MLKKWVGSKAAKNPYFGIFGLENSFFKKIIGFMYFRAQFRSLKKLEKIFWKDKNLKITPNVDFF
jgi:hypothetical protein